MNSSVSAASKLAAAAGLRPLHERQTALAANEDYKKLTKTPFRKRELDKFKEILRLKRAQVTGDVNDMETEALIGRGSGSLSKLPQHMADAGSDTYDQTLNLDLAAGQRKLLKEIDDALARIENKTYGICELLGKPISKERLENTPWARYSIEGARRKEMLGY
jgi:RNA polymerase-binding transcription factor DksA